MNVLQSSCHLQDSQRVKKVLCRGMDCKRCNEFRVNYDQAVINYHLQDMAKKEPVGLDKTAPETYLKLKSEIERLKSELEKRENETLQEIDQRDYWESRATRLAEMVGEYFNQSVGEHSSNNNPVDAAELILQESESVHDIKAENEKLKSANTELTKFVAVEIGGHKSTMELVRELQAELDRVRGIAEKLARFYGDKSNWDDRIFLRISDEEKTEHYDYCGGKLAREMAKELKENEK